MAKTLEALKRAEEERRHQSGESGVLFEFGNLKMTPEAMVENHRLKYNLLRLTSEGNIKTILFSSCNGGEGTSTVVLNFANTLASYGEKVLLVDANLRSPSLHAALNLGRENGLTDLLLGRNPLTGVIKETESHNLFFIPSGPPHPNPMVILESDSLESHIEKMKERSDWVLFDSSPLTRFMDAIVLAPKIDGVVIVVESEKTRWEVAESARERIINGNGKILGVVLNKRRYHVPKWLYNRM